MPTEPNIQPHLCGGILCPVCHPRADLPDERVDDVVDYRDARQNLAELIEARKQLARLRTENAALVAELAGVREDLNQVLEALRLLHDYQEGPPSYKPSALAQWDRAMEMSISLLVKLEPPLTRPGVADEASGSGN